VSVKPDKPHIRIVSSGVGPDTHLVYVDEDGRNHDLPGVTHVTWSIDADKPAFASVVFHRPIVDVAVMEGVYELLEPLGASRPARLFERTSGLQSGGATGPRRGPAEISE
jgi:hypothetical protein